MFRRIAFCVLVALPVGCAGSTPELPAPGSLLTHDRLPGHSDPAAAAEALAAFEQAGERASQDGYRLAAGDVVTVAVFNRQELSTQQTIGPDGMITLPEVGDVEVGGLSRRAALTRVKDQFAPSYPDLSVTLRVDTYTSMNVVVLGSVGAPGEYLFSSPPTLLRALGQAQGLAADERQLMPERCAIMRGADAVLWVDLHALLREGDMSLNVQLLPGDVVHVAPESQRLFYVLGEVASPGIYPLRRGTSILDALAVAGGTLISSDDDEVRLLRPVGDEVNGFDYEEFTDGDELATMALAAGDVVYVPRRGLAEAGWIFQQIAPVAQLFLAYEITND